MNDIDKNTWRKCPFCNSDDTGLETDNSCDLPVYFIMCYDCTCQGGEGITERQAITLWNMRGE